MRSLRHTAILTAILTILSAFGVVGGYPPPNTVSAQQTRYGTSTTRPIIQEIPTTTTTLAPPTTTTTLPPTTTTTAPPPAPLPVAEPATTPISGGDPSNPATWDTLAQCESGGNWAINTGNGYSGGLQFHAQTWSAYGGQEYAAYAYQASREQQIIVAKRVWAEQGWAAWPACTRSFGWR